MVKKEYVCRVCKMFTTEKECPNCKNKDLSASWKGLVIINNPNESEIAQALEIKREGKFALFIS